MPEIIKSKNKILENFNFIGLTSNFNNLWLILYALAAEIRKTDHPGSKNPILLPLHRFNNRMSRRMKVFSRVSVSRVTAAVDVPTRFEQAQVIIAIHLQAFFTAVQRFRSDSFYFL
jgi:hypothetical protein